MTVLVRKIAPSKWGTTWESVDRLPGDAVTADMKTQGNTLSFWRCIATAGMTAEDSAILAILGTLTKLEKIDLVLINEEDFPSEWIKPSDGGSIVAALNSLHVDLVNVDYSRVGQAAQILAPKICAGDTLLITREQVREKLKRAIDVGLLDINVVPQKLKESLLA